MTVHTVVAEFRTLALSMGIDVLVIVVDDHSTDRTADRARRSGALVVAPQCGRGLAEAFRTGVSVAVRAGARWIVHADADGQYYAEDLVCLMQEAQHGADLVVGDRLHKRPLGMSAFRYRGNRWLSRLASGLAGVHVHDSQSGYRLFSAKLAQAIPITGRFTYTQEQLIRAARGGYQISSVPIGFRERAHGGSRLVRSPLAYGLRVMPTMIAMALLGTPRFALVRDF
jgi:glycosyltransferase involved in cell wall biosynthesis